MISLWVEAVGGGGGGGGGIAREAWWAAARAFDRATAPGPQRRWRRSPPGAGVVTVGAGDGLSVRELVEAKSISNFRVVKDNDAVDPATLACCSFHFLGSDSELSNGGGA